MAGKEIRCVIRVTEEEKQRIKESEKRNKVPKNSFYTKPNEYSVVSRFDRASNRRAAGRYLPNA
jgi:hypothetical protein